ncbi:hypothetical protein ACOMHN_061320 [Nucella lapillus]
MAPLARYDGLLDCHRGLSPVAITLLIMLIFFPLFVLSQCSTLQAQELEFVVLNTCVHKEQNKTSLTERNCYAHVGCSLCMICRYRVSSGGEDYCAGREATNLTVVPCGRRRVERGALIRDTLVELNRTKCALTVEFTNLTADMEGGYHCMDLETGNSATRKFEIGEPPVAPTNISVVYSRRPGKHRIALKLNPVKTGRDLNALGTTWAIKYKWRDDNYQECSLKSMKCGNLGADAICQPCVIKMDYSGCCQYTGFGHINRPITFLITVSNMFGEVSVSKKFHLYNWVKPRAVGQLQRVGRNESALKVRVSSSRSLDACHYLLMRDHQQPLKVQWTLDLLSAREQSLLLKDSREFYDDYGFVRNLEDDQAAVSRAVAALFPKTSQHLLWKSEHRNPCDKDVSAQSWEFTGLPFPGYHYGVSVQSWARYPGDTGFLNLSLAMTEEVAPLEGPELHDSFAYCDTAKAPVTCMLYFKEIPRSKRGSGVVNYTVTVALMNACSPSLSGRRSGQEGQPWSEHAGSQANSALIHDLQAGEEYNVTVQAYNAKGASPASSKVLHVYGTPPPTAPRNVVLEYMKSESEWFYHLTWSGSRSADSPDPVQYYAHHCNATDLQLEERTGSNHNIKVAEKPLKCVTNMVSIPVKGSGGFRFSQPPPKSDLKAAFFVSAVIGDGISSGLHKVGCFYNKDTLPKKVDHFQVENTSHALRVVFSLPCGSDINDPHGRPRRYAIGIVKLTHPRQEGCGSLMQKSDVYSRTLSPHDDLQAPVVYKRDDLEPDTLYLVGVNVADPSIRDHWTCMKARTTDTDETVVMIIFAISAVIFVVFVICFILYCLRRTRKKNAKFGLQKEDFRTDHFTGLEKFKERRMSWESDIEGCNNGLEGPPEVVKNGLPRYHPLLMTTPLKSRVLPNEDDGASADDDDDSNEDDTEDSRSGSEEDSDDDGEVSEDNAEDGGHGVEQPLVSSSSTPLQHAPASPEEDRALFHTQRPSRQNGRKTSEDKERCAEEKPFRLDPMPQSDLKVGTPSTTPAFASESTYPQSSSSLLGSENQTHHLPDRPEHYNPNPAPRASHHQSFSAGESETGLSAGQGVCQVVPQHTRTIGQYSIEDILKDAATSFDLAAMGSGAEGGGSDRQSEPLVMEDIIRAAAMCPWRNSLEEDVDLGVHGAGDLSACRRDSACFTISTSGAGSVKELDAESESGTGNS